jgi:predicted nucleic acid-binding protein
MAYLLDTNILARLANAADPNYAVAAHAVLELHRRGEVLHITPQVLIEFRNVATRPKTAERLGPSNVGRRDRGGDCRGDLSPPCGHAGHLPGMGGTCESAGRHRQTGS